MLMNIETLKYDKALMKFFDVPLEILPTIRSSSEVYGLIKFRPLQHIPLAGCLGDQQSALVGQECLTRGRAKATYGTGCFLLYNTGTAVIDSYHGLISTVAYQMGPDALPVYALEGSVAVAGAALGWLRDNLNLIGGASESESAALEVENNGDVYFVPAFSGLYAPYWDPFHNACVCMREIERETIYI